MSNNKYRRNKQKQNRQIPLNAPETLTVIDYASIYGEDGVSDSVADCLKDIPTAVVLHYVIMQHWTLHFAINNPVLHNKAIYNLLESLPKKYKNNVIDYKKRNKSILIDTQSTLHICYEALRNYVPMDMYEDIDINPAQDEIENIYRAYLKCNSYWTSKQRLSDNLIDISLGIEIPFIEFKNHKKVHTAAYKSLKFFEFCEKTPPFDGYLKCMLEDIGLSDWHQYINIFVSLYSQLISKPYIVFDDSTQWAYNFFLQFSIDIDSLKKLGEWDGNKSLKYLRDHFIVKFDRNTIQVLSPDLVCDKLYQGLKFMMWKSIKKHSLKHPNGKILNSFQTFLGLLGSGFSEKFLITDIIRKSMEGHVDSIYTDEDINAANISSPSDFYIKKGDTLIVIEYKDALFPDDSKYSGDIQEIKKTINNKICLDKEKDSKPGIRDLKGVGQLLDTIARIVKGEYNQYDSSYANIKVVLPVVVTTDITFSALGVNAYVTQQTNDMIKRHNETFKSSNIFTAIPTIIDLDSMIDIAYMLHKGSCDIFDLISKYMAQNYLGIQSFRVFIEDQVIKNKSITTDELQFLISSLPI